MGLEEKNWHSHFIVSASRLWELGTRSRWIFKDKKEINTRALQWNWILLHPIVSKINTPRCSNFRRGWCEIFPQIDKSTPPRSLPDLQYKIINSWTSILMGANTTGCPRKKFALNFFEVSTGGWGEIGYALVFLLVPGHVRSIERGPAQSPFPLTLQLTPQWIFK